MLGTRLDYFILRSMAHRNLASEQRLDEALRHIATPVNATNKEVKP